MTNIFLIIFILTIMITRIFLFLYPIPAPTISKFRIHHYMYGIVGIFLGLLFNSLIIFAIGLGLFVDELTYILIQGKNHKDNYSTISLIGTLVFVVLVFVFRNYFVLLFN